MFDWLPDWFDFGPTIRDTFAGRSGAANPGLVLAVIALVVWFVFIRKA